MNLVQRDPTRRVRHEDAARACGLRRSQFDLVFKEAMGMSFGRFVRRARLTVAAHLLLATDLSTAAIAVESGFADASHLHRTFVRHYGHTPGEYRSRRRQPE